jgi:copper(I)-binding protein
MNLRALRLPLASSVLRVLCVGYAVACSSDEGSWRSSNGEIAVSRVAAPAPANVGSPDSATMAVYATIANTGRAPDTLVSVSATHAASATLHSTMDHGGMQMMMPADPVAIAPSSIVRLAPGGTHVMLEGLTRRFAPGDTVPLTFVFRRSGAVNVNASVFAYEDLQRALEP